MPETLTPTRTLTRVVNVTREPCDVYIGRGGPWGNPYPVKFGRTRAQSIAMFRAWVYMPAQSSLRARARYQLRGKRLGCHCKPWDCHGDVWVEVAESDE